MIFPEEKALVISTGNNVTQIPFSLLFYQIKTESHLAVLFKILDKKKMAILACIRLSGRILATDFVRTNQWSMHSMCNSFFWVGSRFWKHISTNNAGKTF